MRIHDETDTLMPLAHLLEAVAEPTRLRILNVLQASELCVCELQAALGLSEPTVSRHLARLRFAHLVAAERDGARMAYRLTTANSPTTVILQRFLIAISKQEPALQRDLAKLRCLIRGKSPESAAGKRALHLGNRGGQS